MGEIEVREEQRGIIKPAGSPKDLTDALKAYKDMQESLDKAMPDCIMTIQGKKFRKKNYWRGVKTAFNLKVECIKEERIDDIADDWGYLVTYRATAPNGSTADGDGACTYSEKSKGNMAATLHNIRSQAHTRAFNRAVSNLVGFGEVSAEEVYEAKDAKEPIKQPEAKKPETDESKPDKPSPTGDIISEAQRKRLYAISKKANVFDDDVKAFIATYGFESSKEITKDKYQEICEKVEAGNLRVIPENIPDKCIDCIEAESCNAINKTHSQRELCNIND